MSTTADDTPAERPGGPAGPPAPRPGAPPDPGVAVILWPEEEQRRRRLEVAGIPRLLVIAGGEPPADLDVVLEDWVRVPVEQPDLDRRVAILAARSGVATPFIDDGDLLHCGGRWVALPASEARLAVPLVEHFGNLVAMESLLATAEPDKPSSLRAIRVGIARAPAPHRAARAHHCHRPGARLQHGCPPTGRIRLRQERRRVRRGPAVARSPHIPDQPMDP